jgi:hypothetical protein
VKGSCYKGQLAGSPRFPYRFSNNYCHWYKNYVLFENTKIYTK